MGKKCPFKCKTFSLFLPCNIAAVQCKTSYFDGIENGGSWLGFFMRHRGAKYSKWLPEGKGVPGFSKNNLALPSLQRDLLYSAPGDPIYIYIPPINFWAISLAILRHVADSYNAITPFSVDICPPPLTRVLIFTFIILQEKRPSFVNYSDSDIRKLVSNVVSEITKRSTKYQLESWRAPIQVFWGTGRAHLSSIKLTPLNNWLLNGLL